MSLFKKLFKKEKQEDKNTFQLLTIKEVIRETEKAVTLVFQVPEDIRPKFDFIPGQYLTLKATVDGQELRRAYSLCSLPEDDDLRVTVKEMPDGFFSKFANRHLTAGDVVDVMPPTGKFIHEVQPNASNHYVAFAGGSGITPIMSVLKSVVKHEPDSRFTLFYGNRTVDDIIFKDELERLERDSTSSESATRDHPSESADQSSESAARDQSSESAARDSEDVKLKVVHVLSDELSDFTNYFGFIDDEMVAEFSKKYFKKEKVTNYMLCGPGEMITSIIHSLEKIGVDKSKIKTEVFTAPLESDGKQSNAENIVVPATIKVTYGGKETEVAYNKARNSVLDTVLDAGINVPFSCMNGVCSTCSAKLKSGKVTMDQNFALETDDLNNGYILTCQSHPTTSVIEVDYDDNLV